MREIKKIAVHCAATKASMDIGAKEIRDWHVNGNKWSDIGYHKVIRRDGMVEDGRPETKSGAHVAGHNSYTLAVCLVGGIDDTGAAEDNFTTGQFIALRAVIDNWCEKFGLTHADVMGHRDFPNVAKACPSFDVQAWLAAS